MESDNNPCVRVHKSKTSSLCFFSCFRLRRHHLYVQHPPSKAAVIWDKTRDIHSLSDIRDKCRSMLGLPGSRQRRHSSADFRYDPLSYSLNFDDGFSCCDDHEAQSRKISASLPSSPPSIKGFERI
ncbi:hypothetical protein F511_02532 [Dorcoceras hygrometricum]|nr:hypothetical protein F511_02532 [Dorcoceras hygrometricum]